MLACLVLKDMCSEVVVRVHSSAPYKTATSPQTQALASPMQMLPSHIPHHRDDQCPRLPVHLFPLQSNSSLRNPQTASLLLLCKKGTWM